MCSFFRDVVAQAHFQELVLYVWIPLRIHPLTFLYWRLYHYAAVRLALPALRPVVGSPPGVFGLIMLVGKLLSYYHRRPLTLLLALDK